MTEQVKSAADALKQIRQEMTTAHTQDLAVQARHLCLCSVRDVAVVLGAVGLALYLGREAAFKLAGRWRAVPFVAGGVGLLAARFVPSERMRFVTRSSIVVGSSAMMLSTVHFTLQATLDEIWNMEA